jgi:hypothetical protein
MTLKVVARKYAPILLLICIPLLAGSQCAFIFSSGDNSNDDDEKEDIIVVASGSFGAVPVAGANYRSGSVSGVTGSNGEFEYEVDRQVQFFIGDIPLGRAVDPKAVITTLDLVDGGAAAVAGFRTRRQRHYHTGEGTGKGSEIQRARLFRDYLP